jgi:hypothetical protein
VGDGGVDFVGRMLAVEEPGPERGDGELAASEQAQAVEIGGGQVTLRNA